MSGPPSVTPTNSTGCPDEAIAMLVRDFQQAPHSLFCEQELHAHFYCVGRDAFPRWETLEDVTVPAFHCQYETLRRNGAGDGSTGGQEDAGDTVTFDFAVLRREFCEGAFYPALVNKNELRRHLCTRPPGMENSDAYVPIQFAIELKMAARCSVPQVTEDDVNRLEDRMLDACRKVAAERIRQAYVLGLSHGPLPDLSRAYVIVATCMQLHQARYPDGQLSTLVATPTETVLAGDWAEGVEFPNVAVARGWPARGSIAPASPRQF